MAPGEKGRLTSKTYRLKKVQAVVLPLDALAMVGFTHIAGNLHLWRRERGRDAHF